MDDHAISMRNNARVKRAAYHGTGKKVLCNFQVSESPIESGNSVKSPFLPRLRDFDNREAKDLETQYRDVAGFSAEG